MVNNSAQSTLGELRDPDAEVDGLARSLPSGRGSRSAVGLFRPLRIFGNLLNGINLMLAVQSCLQNFLFACPVETPLDPTHPTPLEGRIAIVTDVGVGPAFGRPDDKLRDEAIQPFFASRWIASLTLAMTGLQLNCLWLFEILKLLPCMRSAPFPAPQPPPVITRLDPVIHLSLKGFSYEDGWMPGSSPGMTRRPYSIIGRPIQSLLSERTAKSGCFPPCKRARAS